MPVRYIKAVPGAGKTKNLIDETYRLMNSDGIDKVAAITFTDRASKELRERIKKKAIEDKNETIIKNLHQANIGTIHNFCARIIRDYGFLINLIPEFQIIEEGESNLLILRRIRSFVLNKMTEDSRIGRELRRIIDLFDFDVDELIYILNSFVNETYLNFLKNIVMNELGRGEYINTKFERELYDNNVNEEILKETFISFIPYLVPITEAIIRELKEFKIREGIMDFNDLQLYALKIIKTHKEKIAERIKHILVDEFQDTDEIQIELLFELHKGGSNLLLVGDPNQSIYSFRGAHPTSQEKLISQSERLVMNKNYRSSRKLIDFYNAVFPNIIKYETMEGNRDDEGRIAICEGDQEECVLASVNELKSVGINDIAILSRRGRNLLKMKRILNEHGFEAVTLAGESITMSPEALDLYSMLYYFYDPSDQLNLIALALSPIFNLSLNEVYENRDKLRDIIDSKLMKYKELARTENLSYVLNRAIRETGYLRYLYESENAREKVDRFLRVLDIVHEKIKTDNNINSLIQWFKLSWEDRLTGPVEDLLTLNKQFIKLMTVHQAKGLEFDAVIIYDMVEGEDKGTFLNVDEYGIFLKSKNSKYYKKSKVVPTRFFNKLPKIKNISEEENRIIYVALTRAKKELYLTLPKQLKNDAYSKFLKSIGISLPIDQEVIEKMNSLKIDIINPRIEKLTKNVINSNLPNFIEPNYNLKGIEIDLEKNLQEILEIAKSRNAKITSLRVKNGNSLITKLSDGTIISEIRKKENTIFINNGEVSQ